MGKTTPTPRSIIRTVFLILIGSTVLAMPPVNASLAQTNDHTLPADLILTAATAPAGRSLFRVDAQTLQISPFYVDNNAYIYSLSWSPTGEYLAILRSPDASDYIEVCLLTRAGVLQSCFQDRITDHAFRERGEDYTVTWSEDGRYAYFMSDYDQFHWSDANPDGTWGSSLVKAEVATGQTQEVVFQTIPDARRTPPILYWTNDLHYIRADLTVIDRWQNTEVTLPKTVAAQGELRYCAPFSPQGNYLFAQAFTDDTLRLDGINTSRAEHPNF